MKGAPEGIRHGKAKHSFEFVEKIRDEHEYDKVPPRKLVAKYQVSPHTLRDWLFYRTRTRA